MTTAGKTDNHDPEAKLALRRHFLSRYHAAGADVLDCCQAGGLLWGQLRSEFSLASYVGLDIAPRKGRLRIDSSRYLQAGGWTHDCIDIDTYGAPWRHWCRLLPNITRPTTVFLTIGLIRMGGGGNMQTEAVLALGIPSGVPAGILGGLHDLACRHCLAMAYDCGLTFAEAIEASSDGNARYLGLRIVKADQHGG